MRRDPDSPSSAPAEQQAAQCFAESVRIMAHLRGADGCPWDREQNFDSIRKYTLEETYEVLDAIERRDWPNLREELGDLLLQVLFYAQMAGESQDANFTILDVIAELNRKLIRRHPHVFGEEASRAAGNAASVDAAVDGSADRVLANWEAIKRAEKNPSASLLDSVVRAQPALSEAAQIGSKAAKVHFDWTDWHSLLNKLSEETAELIAETSQPQESASRQPRIESELGDILFTAAQLARHLDVDPEMALRAANRRFRSRFAHMESHTAQPLQDSSAAELESLWQAAKRALADETSGPSGPLGASGDQ